MKIGNEIIEVSFEKYITKAIKTMGGFSIKLKFPNGWGASVIKHEGSFGYEQGLFELAVLGIDGKLHYENKVAKGDVVGYLNLKDLEDLLRQIKSFK